MSGFNRILRRLRDDLSRPDYGAALARVREVQRRLNAAGLTVRHDTGREWEYAHVLLAIDALRAAGAIRNVVDFGGGNGALAYVLAAAGLATTVLEIDAVSVARVVANAAAMGLDGTLRAVAYGGGAWPLPAGSADVVVAVSVYESLLRPSRAAFFAECRRVLAAGGSLLLTCDYGPDARFVGDAPADRPELAAIGHESGLELVGTLPEEPVFDPEIGPPIKALVRCADGFDVRVASYTFAALHLRRP